MTKPLWMVRAGSNSSHIDEFIESGFARYEPPPE
jgi:hypothetical protein